MNGKIPISIAYSLANFLLVVFWPFRKIGGVCKRKLEAIKFEEEEFRTLFEKWQRQRHATNNLMFWLIPEGEPFAGNPQFWAEYQELSFETRQGFWKWLHKKVAKIKPYNDKTRMDMKNLIAEMELYAHKSNKPFR